jgi:hypothetical protein
VDSQKDEIDDLKSQISSFKAPSDSMSNIQNHYEDRMRELNDRYQHETRVLSEKLQKSQNSTNHLMEMLRENKQSENGSVLEQEKETLVKVKRNLFTPIFL